MAGNDASKYENNDDNKVSSLTVILIAVGGAVGIFLMLLACCCVGYTSFIGIHVYYINTNEIPGELSRENLNLISSHVKITCCLHL